MTAPIVFRGGRKPFNPGRPRIELRSPLDASYSPPATLDRYGAVPAASWGMDANDTLGDCTIADVDHEVKSVEVAAGNPEVKSTSAECVTMYEKITGYNPDDPSSDQGAEMADVRKYWRQSGFTLGGGVHKILLYASLDVSNTNLVKWAVEQFGAVGLGINFPNSAMDQFNAGEPWDVVAGEPDPTEGHAIALLGWDGSFYYILTWSKVWKMTPAFFEKYVEEAWAGLTSEFVNSVSGDDPLAGTLYDLGQQFQVVTGQPNPVPEPGPAPAPTPPGPPPFLQALRGLLRRILRFLHLT